MGKLIFVAVSLFMAIAAFLYMRVSQKPTSEAALTFRNSSNLRIKRLQISCADSTNVIENLAIGEQRRLIVHPKYSQEYRFNLIILFENDSELGSTQSYAPGDEVTVVIYNDKINNALRKTGSL